MTDFAGLINGAIERDVRERFLAFLSAHRVVEFGRARAMTLDEMAKVLACFDGFLLDDSLLDLGVAEIRDLRSRLLQFTRPELDGVNANAVANACFDALACIAALEARLCRCLDRAEVRRVRLSAQASTIANDS